MSVNRLERADQDLVLLALATLSLDRPGWTEEISRVAELLWPQSKETLEEFRRLNLDRFNAGPPLPGLGPTGQFPRGTLAGVKDEAELNIGVVVRKGTVIVAFGTPTAWIGMPPEQARELALALLNRAQEAAQSH